MLMMVPRRLPRRVCPAYQHNFPVITWVLLWHHTQRRQGSWEKYTRRGTADLRTTMELPLRRRRNPLEKPLMDPAKSIKDLTERTLNLYWASRTVSYRIQIVCYLSEYVFWVQKDRSWMGALWLLIYLQRSNNFNCSSRAVNTYN
jgi:hypothetical protein